MRSHGMKMTLVAFAAAAMIAGTASLAPAQPLKQDLASYFLLAQRRASLKNFKLDSACNIGVNCGSTSPNSECGTLAVAQVTFADGSQAAADKAFFRKGGARIWQLFRNTGDSLANVQILSPPVQPFTPPAPPIIPGTCDPGCVVTPANIAALEAACGFPAAFPPCNAGAPVKALKASDCSPASADAILLNGVCDLKPGTYGSVDVQNAAQVSLTAGDYNVCNFKTGRNVLVNANGARVLIPNGGQFRTNNNTDLADSCGDLTVFVQGAGVVSFGRNSLIAAKVCAPQSFLSLGHNNTLIGQFVGDTVSSNLNNRGQCCGGACACYDAFTPTSGPVGTTVTATGGCDMSATTGVRVCGIPAIIDSKTPNEIKFRIPVGAAGACDVEFDSPAGTFLGFTKFTVN